MAVVLSPPKGVTPHNGNGPLPFNNWFLIQNSRWDTTFSDTVGNLENALMTFAGSTGSFQIVSTGEQRPLSSINYSFGNDPANPSLIIFTISGNWASVNDSGSFAFNNGFDQDHFDGQWDDIQGNSGTWTGQRIPYIPLRIMNPPANSPSGL